MNGRLALSEKTIFITDALSFRLSLFSFVFLLGLGRVLSLFPSSSVGPILCGRASLPRSGSRHSPCSSFLLITSFRCLTTVGLQHVAHPCWH